MKKILVFTSALLLCVAATYAQTIIEYDFEKYTVGDSIIDQDGWSVAYGTADSSNNAKIMEGGVAGGKCLRVFGSYFGTHTEVDNKGGKSGSYDYKVSMVVKRPSYYSGDIIFGSNDGYGENRWIKKDDEFGIRFTSTTPELTIANTKPLDEWVYFSYTFNTAPTKCKLREVTFGDTTYTNLNLPMGNGEAADQFPRFRIFQYNGEIYIDNFKVEFVEVPESERVPANSSVSIANVVCQQQYPWNGKVDIDYEVVSDDPNADVWVYASGFDQDANQSMAVRSVTGDGADGSVKPGTHRMTWNVTSDYPGFNSTAFNIKLTALTGGAPYMVVDLSAGADAQSYPVSYLNQVPAGGWTEEYKTTKLVLRLLPPGTFMMGSPSDELGGQSYENLHLVTLTKPFYIGVFEVTQKQWELVMGSNPSSYKGDARPVECVSYNMIRGSINGAGWPTHNQVDADTFMGRLRSKVNMLFDLPTEAQWEYACRANTTTALNSGKNLSATDQCDEMNEVGRYQYNKSDNKGGYNSGHTTVGSYLPNAWGLYDMHGNVCEWCLDWHNQANLKGPAADPKGTTSTSYGRVLRGGSWGNFYNSYYGNAGSYACHCRSAYRNFYYPSSSNSCSGFRLILVQ